MRVFPSRATSSPLSRIGYPGRGSRSRVRKTPEVSETQAKEDMANALTKS